LPDKCCPRFFCGHHLSRTQKEKKKKPRTTLNRQTNPKEIIIGQHLSGKQKQMKKKHRTTLIRQTKTIEKKHRTTRFSFVFVCLIRVVRCFFSFVFVCLISVVRWVFFFCFCLPDKCCPMISSFVFVTSDNAYQANKNKRKKTIGQHVSGKQKQNN
jgi:hypothetical protein